MGRRLSAALSAVVVALAVAPAAAADAVSPQRGVDRVEVTTGTGVGRGWAALEQLTGVKLADLAEDVGLAGVSNADLPRLPAPVMMAVQNAAALSEVPQQDEQAEDDGTDEQPAAASSGAAVAADLTGDGVPELWISSSAGGSSRRQRMVNGADGAVLWQRAGEPSWSTPQPVADADRDGVTDLSVVTAALVDIREIGDFEGQDQESGFEFVIRSAAAVVSGATGEVLWQEEEQEEAFGLSFFGRYTTTEYSFGTRVWLKNVLLTPSPVRGTDADQVIVQRVDQRASAESGGRGAYTWNDDPYLSGVRVTDTARVAFTGATRAALVDAATGEAGRSFTVDPGTGVGFLLAAPAGAGRDDVLWMTFDLPEQTMECVALACLEEPAANRTVAIEAFDAAGTRLWSQEWTDSYGLDVWYGHDLSVDGGHDLLLYDIRPTTDAYDVQVAALDGRSGTQRWRTSLGATPAEMLTVIDGPQTAVALLGEALGGDGGFGIAIHRVAVGSGQREETTEHRVDAPRGDSGLLLGLDEEPYVWATFSRIALDLGGDTDGDGLEDLLISLGQTQFWSDDRPQTEWSRWTVESSANGAAVHSREDETARGIFSWADTSGDESAEFVEWTSEPPTFRVLDGHTAQPVWTLPEEVRGPIADLNADGAVDVLAASGAPDGSQTLHILDGPSHRTLWSLRIPAE